jgi:hypothetical protein
MRVCPLQGHLVDGATRLADDPCEYNDFAVRALVGCSRLKCASCGAFVRGGPPGLELKPGAKVDFELLQNAPSWAELPFIQPRAVVLGWEGRVRLYACRCTSSDIELTQGLEVDHEFPGGPAGTWACAGHPFPVLPLSLGGLRIGGAADWARVVVTQVLEGACPRALELGPDGRDGPAVWLAWLYTYLRGLPAAEELSAAIAERIDDPEPLVFGRVLHFFTCCSGATGVERLIARAEAAPERVAVGHPIPEYDRMPSLWSVLAARHADARVDALIKRLLVWPLSSLSHEVVGETDLVECERSLKSRLGWDGQLMKSWLEDFARVRRAERVDVVANELEQFPATFYERGMKRFLAENVIQIDAAAKGRWRQVMYALTTWHGTRELAPLLVLAGSRIFEGGLASADELRAWIQARRSYGWVNDEWVRPLEAVLRR